MSDGVISSMGRNPEEGAKRWAGIDDINVGEIRFAK
jgi:hypothetical protein